MGMTWMAFLACTIDVIRRVGEIARTALRMNLVNSVLYQARYETVGTSIRRTVHDSRGSLHQVWLVIRALTGFRSRCANLDGRCPHPIRGGSTHSVVTDYIDASGAIQHHLWTAAIHVSRPGRYLYFVVNGTLDMTRFFNDFDPPTDECRLVHSINMASAYMRVSAGPVHSVVCMSLDTLEENILI